MKRKNANSIGDIMQIVVLGLLAISGTVAVLLFAYIMMRHAECIASML